MVGSAGSGDRRTGYVLIAGAVVGLGAAMWSALGVGSVSMAVGDAVALVDGVPIPRTVYDSAVEGLASAKRNPLTDAERREALDRIIDEELLLRRALELGLGESDPSSRKALVNAMLQFSIADAGKREPTQSELVAFYAERPKLIAPQPLLTVRAVSFPQSQADSASRLKASLDQGRNFDVAARESGAEGALLPTGPVIPAKIAEYAGGTIRDTALSLKDGQTAGPIQIGSRLVFVHLVERRQTPPPALEVVRDVVVEEWRKREAEQAFSDYVTGLRKKARVAYSKDAPVVGSK